MVRLHVLEHGYLEATDVVFITEDGKQELVTTTWPDRCYLVEHSRGWLLWDTGLSEDRFLPGPLVLGSYRLGVTSLLLPWLAGLGVTPDDITYLGFSHLHVDHAGNANLFAGSTVVLSAREHAVAFGLDVARGYVPEDYAALRDSRTILVEETYDIFGDGAAVIHAAPGHTLGHQILALSLPNRGPLILAGDALYDGKDLASRRVPAWSADLEQTLRSMDLIKRLVAETNAQLLIHHDPGAWP